MSGFISSKRQLFNDPAVIHHGTGSHELLALVDSRVIGNCINKTLVTHLSLKTHTLDCTVCLISMDDQPLA